MDQASSHPPRGPHRDGGEPDPADTSTPAALAHELNNLLDGSMRSVSLALRALRDDNQEADPDGVIERLESADHLMHRMIGLVRTLGNTNPAATPDPVSATPRAFGQTVGEALDHALRSVAAEVDEQGITVSALADPGLTDAPADALYTVMSNGLRNAVESIQLRRQRANDPNGADRVELRLEQDGDDVLLTLADTGAGLDPAVFEAGGAFRFGVTTKPDGNGIGMGLCRQVARALGGTLRLTNRTPRGAVLTLRFPRQALRPVPEPTR